MVGMEVQQSLPHVHSRQTRIKMYEGVMNQLTLQDSALPPRAPNTSDTGRASIRIL